jgi:leucyl-tRNA synthetase
VIAETFFRRSDDGTPDWINPADVDIERDERGRVIGAHLISDGQPVEIGGIEKMAKSKNNGVDPQTMVDKYGADTVRLFSMFAAPPEQSLEWSEAGVEGMARFLRRVHAQLHKHLDGGAVPLLEPAALNAEQKALRRKLHETIDKVGDDYARRYTFNTAIAAIMELVNAMMKADDASPQGRAVQHEAWNAIVLLLNPIAPHLCHALWQALGHPETLLEDVPFPKADPSALRRDAVTLAVQVNGKLRGQIEVAADAPREAIEQRALAEPMVQRFTEGLNVRKVIVVPGKIVNIVAN